MLIRYLHNMHKNLFTIFVTINEMQILNEYIVHIGKCNRVIFYSFQSLRTYILSQTCVFIRLSYIVGQDTKMHVCIIICAKIDHLIALTFKVSVKLRSLITSSWAQPIIILCFWLTNTLFGFLIIRYYTRKIKRHDLCNIVAIQ